MKRLLAKLKLRIGNFTQFNTSTISTIMRTNIFFVDSSLFLFSSFFLYLRFFVVVVVGNYSTRFSWFFLSSIDFVSGSIIFVDIWFDCFWWICVKSCFIIFASVPIHFIEWKIGWFAINWKIICFFARRKSSQKLWFDKLWIPVSAKPAILTAPKGLG